jgi:hypothetical protein
MTTGTVYLSEYHATTVRGVQAPRAPALIVQTPIATSGVAQAFNVFQGELVRLAVDGGGPVNVKWGASPVAVAGFDEHWSANQTEFRTVTPGDTVSVIASGA